MNIRYVYVGMCIGYEDVDGNKTISLDFFFLEILYARLPEYFRCWLQRCVNILIDKGHFFRISSLYVASFSISWLLFFLDVSNSLFFAVDRPANEKLLLTLQWNRINFFSQLISSWMKCELFKWHEFTGWLQCIHWWWWWWWVLPQWDWDRDGQRKKVRGRMKDKNKQRHREKL